MTLYWPTDPSYPCPTCGHSVTREPLAVRALMHDPDPEEWGALTVNILRNWPPETMARLRDFLANRTAPPEQCRPEVGA